MSGVASLTYCSAPESARQFDVVRLELLRRRVLVFGVTLGILLILLTLLGQLALHEARGAHRAMALSPGVGGAVMIVIVLTKLRRRRRTMSLHDLVKRTTILVIVSIVMQIPAAQIIAQALVVLLTRAGLKDVHIGGLAPLLVSMLCVHLAASLILPWSLLESIRPVVVIVFIAAIYPSRAHDPLQARLGGALGLAMMSVPGMLICWYRYSRLRERVELGFLSRRVREVEQELSFARRVHEKLFPRPIDQGPVRFDFRYRPMRQIGGDFIDVHHDPASGALTVALIDVTGHGIAAALAVNRLHGEMKRVLANSSGASPGELLAALNSYVHLTLADESVFATAVVMRIDPPSRRLAWASAGHPPAVLCRAGRSDGRLDMLDSTAMMLGALPPEVYEADEQATSFDPGDLVLLYTDGAMECRDAQDQQLGISGILKVVESNCPCDDPAAALDALLLAIDNHRAGEAEDDTLIAAVALAAVAAPVTVPIRPRDEAAAANVSTNS